MTLATVIVGLVACNFLAAEFAPRDVPYWRTNPRDTVMHHVATDFDVTYRTNLQGLRGAALAQKKPIRIVHVGDSFTFGWGVEEKDTIPAILERDLRTAFGTGEIEVINFGVPGTNPVNFQAYVQKYVRELNPDIVLVSIYKTRNTFLGGDVQSSGGVDGYLKGAVGWAGRIVDPEREARESPLWEYPLYRLAYRAAHRIDYHRANVDWPGPDNTRLAILPQNEAKEWADQMLLDPKTRKDREDELTVTAELLAMMRDATKARFVVLVLPVNWHMLRQSNPRLLEIAESYDMDDRLAELCFSHRLRCVFGTKRLREYAYLKDPKEIRYADSHFTPAANALFAEVAFDAIKGDVRKIVEGAP